MMSVIVRISNSLLAPLAADRAQKIVLAEAPAYAEAAQQSPARDCTWSAKRLSTARRPLHVAAITHRCI